MSKNPRQEYKIAGPATWELIRAGYLAGESAPALAERFGINVHGIRKRITKEKWTKRDYVAALEARGLEPPQRPEPMNVAERYAANYTPPYRPEPEGASFMDMVAAIREAMRAAEPLPNEAPTESPQELERRALAQVGTALAKGRAGDAKALAALADQMRKRADDDRVSATAREEAVRVEADEREGFVMDMFGKAAWLAACMVHHPSSAPAAFVSLIKRWREINFGEGEEDADVRAAIIAKAHAHHVNGEWEKNTPEDVRDYLSGRWEEMRARMER